jgi:hypothetical protein
MNFNLASEIILDLSKEYVDQLVKGTVNKDILILSDLPIFDHVLENVT